MGEVLSVLISGLGLGFTVYMEWPKIAARRAATAQATPTPPATAAAQPAAASAGAVPTTPISQGVRGEAPSTTAGRGKTLGKTLVSLGAALIYGTMFATILIPTGSDFIIGIAAWIFWALCIFWALRYLRHSSWRVVGSVFAAGSVLYLVTVGILVAMGQFDGV